MGELLTVLKKLDYSPLWISLETGAAATVLSFFLGIFLASKTMKARTGVDILESLRPEYAENPPLLYERFSIRVVQSFAGCVIAAVVISLPLMYRNARAAFEQVDIDLIHAARTLGMPDREIFFRVVMPSAGPGVASGTILTFARALGEYGATSMLAGNIPGKTATISQRIAMVIQDGDYLTAGIWVFIVAVISFVIIVLMNLIAGKNMKNIHKW